MTLHDIGEKIDRSGASHTTTYMETSSIHDTWQARVSLLNKRNSFAEMLFYEHECPHSITMPSENMGFVELDQEDAESSVIRLTCAESTVLKSAVWLKKRKQPKSS